MQVTTKEAETWLGGEYCIGRQLMTKEAKTRLGWNCWVYTILSSNKAEDALQVLLS